MGGSKLLVAACRAEKPRVLPSDLFEGVEWGRTIDRALRLGVAAHLHRLVRWCAPPGSVPADALDRLAGIYDGQGHDNALMLGTLCELLEDLRGAGIASIVLDEAALAVSVHEDLALRPVRDLDLLVREVDVAAAEEVLRARGYEPDGGFRPEGRISKRHQAGPFVSPEGFAAVQLRWRAAPAAMPVAVRVAGFWDRAVPADVGGVPGRVLAPDDLVFTLALHLAGSDGFVGKLGDLSDIALALRRHQEHLDWGRFCDTAHWSGAASHAYYALWLTRALLDARIPAAVFDHLERPARKGLLLDQATKTFARWAAPRFEGWQRRPGVLGEWGRSLLNRPTWRGRVGAVARTLYPRRA